MFYLDINLVVSKVSELNSRTGLQQVNGVVVDPHVVDCSEVQGENVIRLIMLLNC